LAVKGNANYSSGDTIKETDFTFKLHGDLLPEAGGAIPTSFEGACQYLQQLQTLIQKANGGKGKPVELTLFPLSDPGLRTKMTRSPEVVICQIDDSDVRRFIELFDNIINIRQQVSDLVEDMRQAECFTDELGEVESLLSSISDDEADLRVSLRELLKAIRSGSKNKTDLKELYDHYRSAQKIYVVRKTYEEWLNRVQPLIEFNRTCEKYGVECVHGNASIDEQINNTDDLYVLYIDNKSLKMSGVDNNDKWKKNKKIFFRLASKLKNEQQQQHSALNNDVLDNEKPARRSACLCVDYDVNSDLVNKIVHYRYGEVRCDDVEVDVSEHLSLNVARSTITPETLSDEDTEETSDHQPGDRHGDRHGDRVGGVIEVILRCPGSTPRTCSNERRRWSCDVCRQPLHLNASDNRFRCKCGLADPYSFTFRCSDIANHRYDNYVPVDMTQLDRQLKALNPPGRKLI